ncbi:SRPBCC family protein [Actinomadura luteofluorescens]|uniref:SRPBCC family protein n=1 Tax=Actinomadura luteofluorescens TaxID=46163 RepID=UPI0036362A5C
MGRLGPVPCPGAAGARGRHRPYGVGTVKKIWPTSERTVAYEPYEHFGYIAVAGLPVRSYRADVRLERRDAGTLLRWEATFEPLIPGTGPVVGFALRQMLRAFTRWLPAHVEDCPPDCPARTAEGV